MTIIALVAIPLVLGTLAFLTGRLAFTAPGVLTVAIDPMVVHVGPVAVSWYGLAVMAAILVAYWLTLREAGRKGLVVDRIADLAIWVILGGFVGARVFHVVDRWDYYAANPLQILAMQNGGLAILGAIVGGALAAGVGAWRQRLPIRRLFDVIAPGLILAQAIGRFGCLVTGDALGPPTDGSWGIVYANPGAMAPQLGVAYQPVFFYEQVWDLAIFAVLWSLRRRLTGDGQIFALYLALYAAGKFALTFLRTETIWFWGLQEAQIVALIAFGVAIALAAWRRPGRPSIQPAEVRQ